jgi:hypothetical protein
MASGREGSLNAVNAGVDRDLLLAFVGTVIPASGANGAMPAASELPEFRELSSEEAEAVYSPVLELLLARSRAQGTESFPSLDLEARESMVRGLQSDHPHIVAGAVGQTLLRYYGADTVVRALGLEARAPHPQGYPVDDTDWELLEPARRMDRIYKTAAGQGDAS